MASPPADPLSKPAIRQPDLAGLHSVNRHFDWVMARCYIGLGLWMIIWPKAVAQSHFAPIHDFLGYWVMMLGCLVFGGARYTALWKNGDWPIYGPLIRMIGAGVGAILVGSIAMALIRQSLDVGRQPSPGIIFYAMLAWGEGSAARRAAGDVRTRL